MKIKAGYINNMRSYLLSVLIFIGIFAVFAAIIPIIVNRFTNDTSSGEIDIFFATAIYVSIAFAISNLLSFNSYISFGMSRKNFSKTSILTNISFCSFTGIIIVLMQQIINWILASFKLNTIVRFYVVDELSHGNVFLSIVAAIFVILLISNIIYLFATILYNTSRVKKLIFILVVSIISLAAIYLFMTLDDQGQIDFMVSVGNFFGVDSQAISLGRFVLSSGLIIILCFAFTSFKDQRREIKTKVA